MMIYIGRKVHKRAVWSLCQQPNDESIFHCSGMLRTKEVDLNFSYFLLDLFSFILFLELGLGLE